MTSAEKAAAAYLKAYNKAMTALKSVGDMIHDLPAPDGEIPINWANVGDMLRIAAELESILPES